MSVNNIQYLRRNEIDILRWDQCIDRATNGLIYAYSFYLDKMSRHWDALVWNDYEAVMPLTWNRKYGLYYLYQPPFTASLGIFGNNLTEALVQEMLQAIPKKFRLIEIDLNAGCIIHPSGAAGIPPSSPAPSSPFTRLRLNYVLPLTKSYEALYAQYRDNVRRNIKKSQQAKCRYECGIDINDVIYLSQWQMQKVSNLGRDDYDRFLHLYHLLKERNQAIACGVYTPNDQLIASCVYFFSHNRAYYILVGNHPNGRTAGASHFLIDRFIHHYAGTGMTLDFEGSDIRNLAFFYSSFGAQEEIYPAYHVNRLPWWAKLFK